MENPRPIEETDPELAELIKEYVNNSKIFKGIDIRKLGRNDICPCGSGKKLKKCHWYFIESRL